MLLFIYIFIYLIRCIVQLYNVEKVKLYFNKYDDSLFTVLVKNVRNIERKEILIDFLKIYILLQEC